MSSVKLLKEYLNRWCDVPLGAFTVTCLIIDVKTSYGVDRVLVRPVNPGNSGSAWVNLDNVSNIRNAPEWLSAVGIARDISALNAAWKDVIELTESVIDPALSKALLSLGEVITTMYSKYKLESK